MSLVTSHFLTCPSQSVLYPHKALWQRLQDANWWECGSKYNEVLKRRAICTKATGVSLGCDSDMECCSRCRTSQTLLLEPSCYHSRCTYIWPRLFWMHWVSCTRTSITATSPSCICPIPLLLPFLKAVCCSKPLSVIHHHCHISQHPSIVGVSTYSTWYQGPLNCQGCVVIIIATCQVLWKLWEAIPASVIPSRPNIFVCFRSAHHVVMHPFYSLHYSPRMVVLKMTSIVYLPFCYSRSFTRTLWVGSLQCCWWWTCFASILLLLAMLCFFKNMHIDKFAPNFNYCTFK